MGEFFSFIIEFVGAFLSDWVFLGKIRRSSKKRKNEKRKKKTPLEIAAELGKVEVRINPDGSKSYIAPSTDNDDSVPTDSQPQENE